MALLIGHPDQSLNYRQITRQIPGVSVGALQRGFATLSRFGLIDHSAVGKQGFYRAHRNHPVLPELRTLVAKDGRGNSSARLARTTHEREDGSRSPAERASSGEIEPGQAQVSIESKRAFECPSSWAMRASA